jgi:hypothetical protein
MKTLLVMTLSDQQILT